VNRALLKHLCTKGKRRTVTIDSRSQYKEIMRCRLRDPAGQRDISKNVKPLLKRPMETIKKTRNAATLSSGHKKAALEFLLMRIGSNLGKIIRF